MADAAAVPAAGGERDRADAAAARARRPRRVLPARALPRAGPGGRARRPPRGSSPASDTPRAARPLRSSSGSDAGLLRRSTREFPRPGVRAAGPGAPPARPRASPRSPSRCWSACPSCSATWAGWPPCSSCSWGWCWPGCWSPASRGSPARWPSAPPRRSPPTWCWCCPRGRRWAGCWSCSASASSPPCCSRCSAGRGTDLVASLAGDGAAARASIGALATLLLLGRTDAGHGRALVALLAVGAALVVGHLVDLVLPRPQLADGVPARAARRWSLSVAGRRGGRRSSAATSRHRSTRWPRVVYGAVLGGVAALMALVASYVRRRGRRGRAAGRRAAAAGLGAAAHPGVLPLAACGPVALALQSVL